MAQGILRVTQEMLQEFFCLPDGFELVNADMNRDAPGVVEFIYSSEKIPAVLQGSKFPEIDLAIVTDSLVETDGEYDEHDDILAEISQNYFYRSTLAKLSVTGQFFPDRPEKTIVLVQNELPK
jgi:hypothetical protein